MSYFLDVSCYFRTFSVIDKEQKSSGFKLLQYDFLVIPFVDIRSRKTWR